MGYFYFVDFLCWKNLLLLEKWCCFWLVECGRFWILIWGYWIVIVFFLVVYLLYLFWIEGWIFCFWGWVFVIVDCLVFCWLSWFFVVGFWLRFYEKKILKIYRKFYDFIIFFLFYNKCMEWWMDILLYFLSYWVIRINYIVIDIFIMNIEIVFLYILNEDLFDCF